MSRMVTDEMVKISQWATEEGAEKLAPMKLSASRFAQNQTISADPEDWARCIIGHLKHVDNLTAEEVREVHQFLLALLARVS